MTKKRRTRETKLKYDTSVSSELAAANVENEIEPEEGMIWGR